MKIKNLIVPLMITFILLASLWIYQSTKKFNPSILLRNKTETLELAERNFDIPVIYNQLGIQQARKDRGVLLVYLWPDFTTSKTESEFYQAQKDGHFGQILIEEAAMRPSINTMIENRRRNLTKVEPAGSFEGLEVEKWYHGKKENPELWSNMFLEMNSSGKVVSYIDCAPIERAPYPHCQHKFIDKGLLYYVTYNKAKYLKDWATQRQKAMQFIDNFENTSNAPE